MQRLLNFDDLRDKKNSMDMYWREFQEIQREKMAQSMVTSMIYRSKHNNYVNNYIKRFILILFKIFN